MLSNPYLRNRYGAALENSAVPVDDSSALPQPAADTAPSQQHLRRNSESDDEAGDAATGWSKFSSAKHVTHTVFQPSQKLQQVHKAYPPEVLEVRADRPQWIEALLKETRSVFDDAERLLQKRDTSPIPVPSVVSSFGEPEHISSVDRQWVNEIVDVSVPRTESVPAATSAANEPAERIDVPPTQAPALPSSTVSPMRPPVSRLPEEVISLDPPQIAPHDSTPKETAVVVVTRNQLIDDTSSQSKAVERVPEVAPTTSRISVTRMTVVPVSDWEAKQLTSKHGARVPQPTQQAVQAVAPVVAPAKVAKPQQQKKSRTVKSKPVAGTTTAAAQGSIPLDVLPHLIKSIYAVLPVPTFPSTTASLPPQQVNEPQETEDEKMARLSEVRKALAERVVEEALSQHNSAANITSSAGAALPPPSVVLGNPPPFRPLRVQPIVSALHRGSPYSSDTASTSPANVAPAVISSASLPRVGVHDRLQATESSPVERAVPTDESPSNKKKAGTPPRYLLATESWRSKGPEREGVHLHDRSEQFRFFDVNRSNDSGAERPSVPAVSIERHPRHTERVETFNRRANEFLRRHPTTAATAS